MAATLRQQIEWFHTSFRIFVCVVKWPIINPSSWENVNVSNKDGDLRTSFSIRITL